MKRRYTLLLLIIMLTLVGCKNKSSEEINDYDSEEIITNGVIEDTYEAYPNYESFFTYQELNEFIMNNEKITDSFLCLDLKKYSPRWESSRNFYYKTESNGKIIDPIICIYATMTDERFGLVKIGDLTKGVSYNVGIVFYPLSGEYERLTFKKYHYKVEHGRFDNVIYVNSGEKKICEIYYQADFNISKDYFQDLFIENMNLFIK